jgi:shikimate dehydrogenase
MKDAMRRAAILGHPIVRALSPVLHRAAYAALGLDWTYTAIDCDEPCLPGFLRNLDESWAGLSLTMPLKQVAVPLLDEVSTLASAVGAVNTVTVTDGSLVGENTDIVGMVAALADAGIDHPCCGGIVGGGATARTALAALAALGARIATVIVRDPAKAAVLQPVAEQVGIGLRILPWAKMTSLLDTDLVVFTLPPGAADPVAPLLRRYQGGVLDVVYGPTRTAVTAAAAAAGARVASGFTMLVHQAARQVQLQTGHAAPLDAMIKAGGRALQDQRPEVPGRGEQRSNIVGRYAERSVTVVRGGAQ